MPRIVSDIVEVYPYRQAEALEFLLLRRPVAAGPVAGWHAVFGHIESGETAFRAAQRELVEETGLRAMVWHQLESVNTFFIAGTDEMHLCPGFAACIDAGAEPRLNGEHDAWAWLSIDAACDRFLWPGQRRAVAEIRDVIIPGGPTADALRIT